MNEATNMSAQAWVGVENRLSAYVRHRVDPLWAEDVTGDILLQLVRHQDGLATAKNPIAWMHRVAANAVTDHYRRRDVERRALAAAEQETGAFHVANATMSEPNNVGREFARCLVPLIKSLPEKYREALLLTEIEGLSQKAAAAHLGLSHSGMKSRVQRGREQLKNAIQQCCAVQFDARGQVLTYTSRNKPC